jgi:[ribosomal protein S5]-alanine N-acetyltransferase
MNTEINYSVFEKFPELETARLILREFTLDDAHEMYALRSDSRVMEFMDARLHQNVAETREMITGILQSFEKEGGINWVLESKHTGKMIGYIGFWRLMPGYVRGEIGYALKPSLWGRGYMKEAAAEVFRFGFEKLKLHSVEANVNPGNKASIMLLSSFGFKKEAHFREHFLVDGGFVDSVIYSLLESDFIQRY